MSKKQVFTSELEIFSSIQELNQQEKVVFDAAEKTAADAYAPYSKFQVGAAALLENGEIIIGNNQENIAYPSGLCAERVAVFAAHANYPNVPIKLIAIYAKGEGGEIDSVVTPCGGCRQVLVEYEQLFNQSIPLLLHGEDEKVYKVSSVESLLPFFFQTKLLR